MLLLLLLRNDEHCSGRLYRPPMAGGRSSIVTGMPVKEWRRWTHSDLATGTSRRCPLYLMPGDFQSPCHFAASDSHI